MEEAEDSPDGGYLSSSDYLDKEHHFIKQNPYLNKLTNSLCYSFLKGFFSRLKNYPCLVPLVIPQNAGDDIGNT